VKWHKHGRIYVPDGTRPWALHYAFPPTPWLRPDGVLRIYLAFCDQHIVGRVGYLDLDATNPSKILRISERPVLDIGDPGAFDENGVLPTCVVPVAGKLYMYYVGYQLGHRVRYHQFQGLALSADGGETFQRVQKTPVLERSDAELHHRTSAFVLRDQDRFRIWYVGGSQWTTVKSKELPVYNLRHLQSEDGIHWGNEGVVCLDFADPDEHAFGRPWVIKKDDGYRMYYSVRRKSLGYRLGYAESSDGLTWQRKDDEVGLDVSPDGWDSEMIAYASIVELTDRVYLFYNGNNCGQTGFGYATRAA